MDNEQLKNRPKYYHHEGFKRIVNTYNLPFAWMQFEGIKG